MNCPKCNSVSVKYGFNSVNKQRYSCKNCDYLFTGSSLARSGELRIHNPDLENHRYCLDCYEYKQFSEFNYNKKEDRYSSYCKSCNRYRGMMSKYKLSRDNYDKMFINQDGKCAICNVTFNYNYRNKSPRIDHNHDTGDVRGLLCDKCNILIGQARDNIIILKSAIKYLS